MQAERRSKEESGCSNFISRQNGLEGGNHAKTKGQDLMAGETALQDGSAIPHLCAPGSMSLKLPETKRSGR